MSVCLIYQDVLYISLPIAARQASAKATRPRMFQLIAEMQSYSHFVVAAAPLLAMPGPTNALLLAAGAAQTMRRALPLILAEIVAYGLVVTPLVLFGEMLGAWRAFGGLALKFLALVIVVVLAVRLWRSASPSRNESGPPLVTPASVFWMTLFNPKSLIFAFAIFPPIDNAADGLAKAGLFAALAVLTGALWIAAGRLLGNGVRQSGAIIGRTAALILCGFAIYLGASLAAELMSSAQADRRAGAWSVPEGAART